MYYLFLLAMDSYGPYVSWCFNHFSVSEIATELQGFKVLEENGRQLACGPIREQKPILLDRPL